MQTREEPIWLDSAGFLLTLDGRNGNENGNDCMGIGGEGMAKVIQTHLCYRRSFSSKPRYILVHRRRLSNMAR